MDKLERVRAIPEIVYANNGQDDPTLDQQLITKGLASTADLRSWELCSTVLTQAAVVASSEANITPSTPGPAVRQRSFPQDGHHVLPAGPVRSGVGEGVAPSGKACRCCAHSVLQPPFAAEPGTLGHHERKRQRRRATCFDSGLCSGWWYCTSRGIHDFNHDCRANLMQELRSNEAAKLDTQRLCRTHISVPLMRGQRRTIPSFSRHRSLSRRRQECPAGSTLSAN